MNQLRKEKKMNINLPKYNQTVYAELLQAMVWNNKCALCAATGTGKSYIAAKFVQEAVIEQDTLILVPFRASAKIWNTLLPQTTTMTYQGLLYNRPELAKYKLIICDEMHHLGADEWGKVFNELMENYHGKLLGLTATPIRFLDGNRNIAKEFFDGNDIQGVQLSEAIQKKILPTFEYVTALYDLPESKGSNELTEKLYSRLDFLRNEYSFQNILRKHLAGRHPVKAIVFVDSIQEIPKVMDSCREIFPDAVHLDAHSKYSGKENAETYEQFENINGDCFLYVVDILNEGIHLSGANTEIMFRRTRSPIVYLQQLGRILSVSNAENDVIIFDFVASHMNMREYTKMQNDTVSRLSFDIGDPCRQIVQHDYALEELELLEKLHQLENNLWTTEEDDLMKKYYEKGKGIDHLLTILPNRTRISIIHRAKILGLAGIRRKYSEEFKDDIKKYYCQKNGIDLILQKYPGYTRAGITNIANRMGLTFRDSQPWTAEEDELLKQNASLSISELLKIFPDRTKAGITGRKHNLGITNRSMHTWTEEEISILKANAELTSEEIRSRFFPDLTISNINSARRKHDCRKDRNWKPEKIERFCALYSKGGWNAVKKDPEFSDMSKKAINGAAHRYNVRSAASHPTTWTEEEKDICREWLAIPEKERPPRRELAKRIPAHSENGIKDMCHRLKTD